MSILSSILVLSKALLSLTIVLIQSHVSVATLSCFSGYIKRITETVNQNNNPYFDTIHKKWKPLDQMTIDFSIFRDSRISGITTYKLKVMMPRFIAQKYGIHTDNNREQYTAVEFISSWKPHPVRYESPDDTLGGQVGEFLYMPESEKWVLCRFRKDKTHGNDYFIAENVQSNYLAPMRLENFTQDKSYFKTLKNKIHERQIKSNARTKIELLNQTIQEFRHPVNVLDLGGGQGQDLWTYAKNNVEKLMMIDMDATALQESISRKKELMKTTNPRNSKFSIEMACMDLNQDASLTIEEIKTKYSFPVKGYDIVSCQFAMHYFGKSKKTLENIFKVIGELLAPGGVFVMTSFEKQAIDNILERNGGKEWKFEENGETKYHIVRKKKNQIKVLLTFSKNEMYEEYVLDKDEMCKIAKKCSFKEISVSSFGDKEHYEPDKIKDKSKILSSDELEFNSLYHVYKYKKI